MFFCSFLFNTCRVIKIIYFLKDARFLKVGSRIFLRILRLSGVTSSSSSVSMKSSACSKLSTLGGVSVSASSAEEERVFVRCFFLQTFNSISSAREHCPITIPEYTFSPGPINREPRSCAENRPYATDSPDSNAIREPSLRYWISPRYGS